MARPAPVGAARRPPATPRPGHRIAPGPPPPLSGQRDPGLVRCVSSGRLRLSRWRSPHLPAWRWNPRAPVGIGVPMQFCPVHHTPPGLSDFSHLMVQVAWQACWTAPRSHAHMILHAQLGTRQGGGGGSHAGGAPPLQRYISPPPTWFRPCRQAVPSPPQPKPMAWPGDQAAPLINNHHPGTGIPLLDPGWPTLPLGSLLDGSCRDPAPDAKYSKHRTDWTYYSRQGCPTLIVASGHRRLRPELIITPDLYDSSGWPRHELIYTQCCGCTQPICCSGWVDRYKY
jgi:hypothetical protein